MMERNKTEVLKVKVTGLVKVFQEVKWAKTRVMQVTNTRIMKGIEYPLVAMSLTKIQCNAIQKPLMQAIKMALKLQKHTSADIMH